MDCASHKGETLRNQFLNMNITRNKNMGIKDQEIKHQAVTASERSHVKLIPEYILERYKSAKWWRFFPKDFVFKTIGEFKDKTICDFGCGSGGIAAQFAKLGASVMGIDISDELIKNAKDRAIVNDVSQNTRFIAVDAENYELPPKQFDFLLAYDILHHVDIKSVLPNICSGLKQDGKAIIIEPISCSPVFKKLRNLIPIKKDASPADRQLNKADLKLISNYFENYKLTFYSLFGRLIRFFPNAKYMDRDHPFTKFFLLLLNGVDRVLISVFPFLWRYYGIVVFVGDNSNGKQGDKI